MKKIAVLASGEGTNAERIIRYFKEKCTAEVALVISSRPSAGVIERARRLGVVCKTVVPSEFRSGEALRLLQEAEIDFVVLAGFLSRIPDEMVHAYEGHMVNIHPSLLPKFGGNGMYGMHVHEAVLAAGEKESGITIQYINEKYVLCFRKTLLSRWLPGCMNWNTGTIRRWLKSCWRNSRGRMHW